MHIGTTEKLSVLLLLVVAFLRLHRLCFRLLPLFLPFSSSIPSRVVVWDDPTPLPPPSYISDSIVGDRTSRTRVPAFLPSFEPYPTSLPTASPPHLVYLGRLDRLHHPQTCLFLRVPLLASSAIPWLLLYARLVFRPTSSLRTTTRAQPHSFAARTLPSPVSLHLEALLRSPTAFAPAPRAGSIRQRQPGVQQPQPPCRPFSATPPSQRPSSANQVSAMTSQYRSIPRRRLRFDSPPASLAQRLSRDPSAASPRSP
ncbi:hypothetical protein L1887_54228 [Cichorium endivia]|nr:hypothetical protein L1887_54228 [Cichorium endivia]